MKKNNSKLKSKGLSKTWSIVILTVFSVLMILGIVFAFVPLQDGQLGIVDYNNFASNIKLGLDVKGGVYAVFAVDKQDFVENRYVKAEGDTDEDVNRAFQNAVEGTVSRLTDLLVGQGYSEAQVAVTGSGDNQKIRVEVPDVDEPEEIFDLIAQPATLTMCEATVDGSGNITKTNPDEKPLITGADIQEATVGMDEGKYCIVLNFNRQGSKKFAEATANLTGKKLGIFLDGRPIMAPNVNESITTGRATITGDYTYQDAYEYAMKIQSGALGVNLSLDSSSVISASLGKDAVNHGLIAGGVGLLIIFIIMIARYRLLGVAASLSLIFFAVTYVFILSIFPWVQLSLPGIAGILLSIGMAVDANVIIFERIRELMSGNNQRDIRASVNQGFRNSLSAIIDGNVTTLIGAIVLAIVAISTIKSFAMTLLIGIVISLISSLLVCRLIIKCFLSFNDSSVALYALNVKEQNYSIEYKNNKLAAPTMDKNDKNNNDTAEVNA